MLFFIDLQVKLKMIFCHFLWINFELTLEKLSENNPYLVVAIGDFNAKLRHWYSQGTNTFEGISVENVASQFVLHQTTWSFMLFDAIQIETLMKVHPHVSSYIHNLVLTSQPDLIVDSGTHPSQHPNCHQQIIYAKFNLKIHYPPPYTRELWLHKDSNDNLIRSAVNQFKWNRAFENKKTWMRKS